MSALSDAQQTFARDVARLILWITEQPGCSCSFGEAHRPEWVAREYAAQGKGSMRSLHIIRLAVDLNLFRDGKYQTDSAAYAAAGRFWKSLHPDNRWGGDFKNMPDGNHFSRAWQGRA